MDESFREMINQRLCAFRESRRHAPNSELLTKDWISLQRYVRLVAIGAKLTAASLFIVFLYSVVIHQFESDGPVERWMKIGIERHRLEELHAAAVLIPEEYYESEQQRLLSEESRTLSSQDFPQDMADLARYKEAGDKFLRWPFVFWLSFAASVMTAIAAESWLRGVSYAESHARSVSKALSHSDATLLDASGAPEDTVQ